jgi:hypothetical protein
MSSLLRFALVCGSLLLISCSGQELEGTQVTPGTALPALSSLVDGHLVSNTLLEHIGRDTFARSASATLSGTNLNLPAGLDIGWAIYAFTANDELLSATVDFGPSSGFEAWVGLSNFEEGHWEISGPYSSDASVALAPANRSVEGNIFVAVVVQPGMSAKVAKVGLSEAGFLPVARCLPYSRAVYAGLTVTLDGSDSSDDDGPLTKYEWDLDGDGVFELDSTPDPTATFLAADTGSQYTSLPKLRVTDSVGNQSVAQAYITVYPHMDPWANFSVTPPHGMPGDSVVFDSNESSDGQFGLIVKREWDLNDDGVYEFQNEGTETSVTSSYPVPAGRKTVHLRVTDDEGNQVIRTRTISSSASIVTSYSKRLSGLQVVNGNPAVVFSSSDFYYSRALDRDGQAWPAPIALDYSPAPVAFSVVDNKPAVTFGMPVGNKGDLSLAYMTSSDADGANWLPPVEAVHDDGQEVSSDFTPLGRESLTEINGRPAIMFGNYPQGVPQPRFVLAQVADGTAWNAPVTLPSGNVHRDDGTLTVLNGKPACFLYGYAPPGAFAVYATDAEGQQWGAPWEVVGPDALKPRCTVVDGKPVITYISASLTEFKLSIVRSLDYEGLTWSVPQALITSAPTGFAFIDYRLRSVDGRPCLLVLDSTDVSLLTAKDPDGAAWNEPEQIANVWLSFDPAVDLVDLHGTAGIVYNDNDAVWFDTAQVN